MQSVFMQELNAAGWHCVCFDVLSHLPAQCLRYLIDESVDNAVKHVYSICEQHRDAQNYCPYFEYRRDVITVIITLGNIICSV